MAQPSTSCDICICNVYRVKKEIHLQEKYIRQGHYTSCDLLTCKVSDCQVKWFRRRCIYKKRHESSDRRTTDRLWYEINISLFLTKIAGKIRRCYKGSIRLQNSGNYRVDKYYRKRILHITTGLEHGGLVLGEKTAQEF